MGHKQAKPEPPQDNPAVSDNNLAVEGLTEAADNFLQSVRLGDASLQNLGYKLTNNRLTDQEVKMIVQSSRDVTREGIHDAVGALFSGDWETVVNIAADELIPFLSEEPKPANTASSESWSKSYLYWEFNSLVQYSVYIKKTQAKSLGTTTEDDETTMISAICRGVVDYEFVDPQVVVFEVLKSQPGLDEVQFTKLISDIEQALTVASRLSILKKSLVAGVAIANPTPSSSAIDA